MAVDNQFALQLLAIHAGHLHVADHAIDVMQAVRVQERFSAAGVLGAMAAFFPRLRYHIMASALKTAITACVFISSSLLRAS